jgi:hypothetical protein
MSNHRCVVCDDVVVATSDPFPICVLCVNEITSAQKELEKELEQESNSSRGFDPAWN